MRANRVRDRRQYAFPPESQFKPVFCREGQWADIMEKAVPNFTVAYIAAMQFGISSKAGHLDIHGYHFPKDGEAPQHNSVSVMTRIGDEGEWRPVTDAELDKTRTDWAKRQIMDYARQRSASK